MRTRWLAACGLLLSAAFPAAAQPPSLTVGFEACSSPDRPTDLVQLVKELTRELCGSDAERPHHRGPVEDGRRVPRLG